MLTMPERTALNIATRYPTDGALLNVLTAYFGVDQDVVYTLVDRELLAGPHRWLLDFSTGAVGPAPEHRKCCMQPWREKGETIVRFRLTSKGHREITNDALTKLLKGLGWRPRGTLTLAKALVGYGASRPVLDQAWSHGLITAHWADGGQEITCLTDHEFAQARGVNLVGTAKIRNVLGVDA